MAFGAKGAIGAAMGAAGRSLASYGERTYREQLNERLEAARQKREDNIRTRTEKFQEEQATTAHKRAKERIKLTAKEARKTALERIKAKPSKPPKFETFEIGDPIELDGRIVENAKVKAKYEKDAPDVGLGKGWVPVTFADIKDPARAELLGYGLKLGDDYQKENKEIVQQETAITKLKDLLARDRDAVTGRAIQTQLAELFSTNSRAIAEVEAWGNLGTLAQRFGGAVSKFTTGSLLESQYEDIERLVDDYAKTTMPKFRENLDEKYEGFAEILEVPKELILRKTLLDKEPTKVDTLPSEEKKIGPKSIEQIEEDAKKYGWDADTVNRIKSQWGLGSPTEGTTRFR